MSSIIPKAYVIAVTMGYGHLRPAYALKDMAYIGHGLDHGRGIINADDYPGIPPEDKKMWETIRRGYEFVSRFKRIPIIGEATFDLMDHLQEIAGFYPRRDLTKPIWQLRATLSTIKKKKWGKDLIDKLNRPSTRAKHGTGQGKPLPLVTTFFTIAHMAEYWGYRGPIYCVVTDTDVSRAWVALNPKASKIMYCAPSYRVAERLKLYGVNPRRIYLTGFPLPKTNLGNNTDLGILRHDIALRILNLDPARRYLKVHGPHVAERLSIKKLPKKSNHPLTLTFAVGGAGAQREIGAAMLKSLRRHILEGRIRVNLIAGVHSVVRDYFIEQAKKNGLEKTFGKFVRVLYQKTKEQYFAEFNKWLRTTDILWTKPSELSFYAGLGLPIIIAPPIGSQEDYNQSWLLTLDAGVPQEDPKYAAEWLFDWLRSGFLAKAAMSGYREAFKFGTFNIERLVAGKPSQMKLVETVSPY
ncbi:hypothetical protein A3B21_03310 [Candidatus Uhrbacteria bacterium RIFCSPLOWO2_01_FULL_47_24]|uniref:Glycosyl transferase family 28 C-terminal domain-containing protein n=1 Tax=Candidatus Uhrbacteria bacterium RIFCSPLOWO2_01_FULL_47_24 TaxID=1802401 RepID=A0A1F7UP52_9BACT|nr:MAG: hypothetical protein A2753_02870 [Candidatus Uhrbacteria bacterium RIFCSPHIGHO2_01_FULL_47_11]OGL68378.1 MAG: hypothetical protein A3D58_04370 [Candidatus Uhrbacteria bacterium RIFCSPHIGHO2_02_FULL_46_47]OGL75712.1 MAG: hypothetical protein A3F52_02260 [Candidatus Uhrbacteria bacterium RIFCSPHIGHO2_12_FULL_47_11]OGL80046.1 MAG: hypothetical protein A3B21_03310 [Candidatus Uhrbacteria bacterium RIFCSPLOWO2_01_FULL_47_24]OGL84512.1 MAG: hypothetical protein A3J03_01690 [Candidatus Uhrbact